MSQGLALGRICLFPSGHRSTSRVPAALQLLGCINPEPRWAGHGPVCSSLFQHCPPGHRRWIWTLCQEDLHWICIRNVKNSLQNFLNRMLYHWEGTLNTLCKSLLSLCNIIRVKSYKTVTNYHYFSTCLKFFLPFFLHSEIVFVVSYMIIAVKWKLLNRTFGFFGGWRRFGHF